MVGCGGDGVRWGGGRVGGARDHKACFWNTKFLTHAQTVVHVCMEPMQKMTAPLVLVTQSAEVHLSVLHGDLANHVRVTHELQEQVLSFAIQLVFKASNTHGCGCVGGHFMRCDWRVGGRHMRCVVSRWSRVGGGFLLQ